jgi:ABC-2 type transport system ATP-binding protein
MESASNSLAPSVGTKRSRRTIGFSRDSVDRLASDERRTAFEISRQVGTSDTVPARPQNYNLMIRVKELTKRYARTTAVDHISFEVQKGQIVGFLGPNGAGKTTTMRMLTCFLPPTSGTATVAGFDVLEAPMDVKRRIGYLPEIPPLYHEMRTAEYLAFVAKIKGLRGLELAKRVNYVLDRCAVADVKDKVLSKLSKGYRQRVGLAQAIVHNPDVLILDEPTAGLDPKQINETRELIRSLAGDHTIILSTHILPEVEQTCQQVIIINKGKLVATDSVNNLQNRSRGAGSVLVEIAGRQEALDSPEVKRRLEKVPGVSRVLFKEKRENRFVFEVDGETDRAIRGDLARVIVESGWDLNELRTAAVSLEEIFLQLTGSNEAKNASAKGTEGDLETVAEQAKR